MLHVNKMALRAVTSGLAAHLQLFFSPVGDHDASILTELLQATYHDGLEDIWVTYKGNWVDFTAMGNIKENERIDYLTVGTRRDNEASENCGGPGNRRLCSAGIRCARRCSYHFAAFSI